MGENEPRTRASRQFAPSSVMHNFPHLGRATMDLVMRMKGQAQISEMHLVLYEGGQGGHALVSRLTRENVTVPNGDEKRCGGQERTLFFPVMFRM
jgi:hypothetical protein